jgi:hypothetical protein
MKTFRILPWYFLLLILGLCVAIMKTTEGMIVADQLVNATYTKDAGIQLLTTKSNEFINNNAKTKRPLCIIFVSNSYKGRTNMTNVKTELNKNKSVDYILFTSNDDTKANLILQHISMDKLSTQNPVNPLVVLVANGGYKPANPSNQRYVMDTARFNEIKKIIDKFTTK